MMHGVQAPPSAPERERTEAVPRHRRGRAGLLTGFLLAALGTSLALVLTTAAPPPTSLPPALQVAAGRPAVGPATPPPAATRATTTTLSPATASTRPSTTVPPSSTTTPPRRSLGQPGPATQPAKGDGQDTHHHDKADGDQTTVVAPSPAVAIEDGAGHRIGGDS